MGMQPDKVLTMGAYPALLGYDHDQEMRFYGDWLARIGGVPGVASAALSRSSPALFRSSPGRFNIVSPRFFSTLGVELARGREFTAADTARSAKVAIINQTTARQHFPAGDALGRPLPDEMSVPRFSRGAQIVGVVRDFKHHFRQEVAGEDLYVPYTQVPPERLGQAVLLVRAERRPADIIPEVRRQTQVIEKDLPLLNLRTLSEELDGYVGGYRAIALLLGVFGTLALVLASIGLYGTMSYMVGRRTREIGIRMALGAPTRQMRWMVLRETLGVVGSGVVLGGALSLLCSRVIASLLFGVQATDPATLAISAFVMLAVTLLAGSLPARRATRVDPIAALRSE
jgi:predicted permease